MQIVKHVAGVVLITFTGALIGTSFDLSHEHHDHVPANAYSNLVMTSSGDAVRVNHASVIEALVDDVRPVIYTVNARAVAAR
jgi:hypothetical protein